MTDEGADRTDDASTNQRDDETPRTGEFGIAEDVVGSSTDDRSAGGDTASENPDEHDADTVEESGANADAPLSSLASSIEERRGRSSERPDDELFSEESVTEIDTDVVWERIDEDEPSELPGESEQEIQVIEKRSYCEQCPFFSSPPEVNCSHDGTEILELVDMDHFRVVDCPKVREDERLERL